MTTLLILSGLMLGLTVQIGWAMWHLLNDKKSFPSSTPTARHIDLRDLEIDLSLPHPPKETPLTSQIFFPPRYISGCDFEHTGSFISGVGGGWNMPGKLVPAQRHHHFMRMR